MFYLDSFLFTLALYRAKAGRENNGKANWYYRDKNSKEIDILIESDGQLHPLEIKRSVNPGSSLPGAFSILDKGSVSRGKGAIICMRPELSAINAENYIVPVWML